MIPSETEKHIVEELSKALQEVPELSVDGPRWQVRREKHVIDAELEVSVGPTVVRLLIEVKKSVFPRDVKQALWQLNQYRHLNRTSEGDRTSLPVLAAESLSNGAKQLLRNEGVGYFDMGGSLYLPALGLYLYVDKPVPPSAERKVTSLFKGKRSRICLTLLNNIDEWFGVKELAHKAEVSAATASETLAALDRLEWLHVRGQGPNKERRISAPQTLLDQWRDELEKTKRLAGRAYYVRNLAGTPDDLLSRLASVCEEQNVQYAITQEAAAQLYAPFTTAVPRVACRFLSGRDADQIIEQLAARPVTEGANLNVIEQSTSAAFLYRQRVKDVWLANPVQVYLDLIRGSGRAREMADHLRRERIGF